MNTIKIRRFLQVFQFGWSDAKDISQTFGSARIAVFLDIFFCFLRYYVSGMQYKKNKIWELSGDEKKRLATELGSENKTKDAWLVKYYDNWKFLDKYSDMKWETSQRLRTKRNNAYTTFYGFGKNCWTQLGATFIFEHYSIGKLKVGNDCLFARGCDIDITGDLEIGNSVKLAENVKIVTHNHSLDNAHELILTPLTICDNVRLGARVIVLPGVKSIGRGSIISAGAVVKHEVPPYAIVMGNPARVVGFRFTPEQIVEYEECLFSENDRLSEELLESNYKKYYLDRLTDIYSFLR